MKKQILTLMACATFIASTPAFCMNKDLEPKDCRSIGCSSKYFDRLWKGIQKNIKIIKLEFNYKNGDTSSSQEQFNNNIHFSLLCKPLSSGVKMNQADYSVAKDLFYSGDVKVSFGKTLKKEVFIPCVTNVEFYALMVEPTKDLGPQICNPALTVSILKPIVAALDSSEWPSEYALEQVIKKCKKIGDEFDIQNKRWELVASTESLHRDMEVWGPTTIENNCANYRTIDRKEKENIEARHMQDRWGQSDFGTPTEGKVTIQPICTVTNVNIQWLKNLYESLATTLPQNTVTIQQPTTPGPFKKDDITELMFALRLKNKTIGDKVIDSLPWVIDTVVFPEHTMVGDITFSINTNNDDENHIICNLCNPLEKKVEKRYGSIVLKK